MARLHPQTLRARAHHGRYCYSSVQRCFSLSRCLSASSSLSCTSLGEGCHGNGETEERFVTAEEPFSFCVYHLYFQLIFFWHGMAWNSNRAPPAKLSGGLRARRTPRVRF